MKILCDKNEFALLVRNCQKAEFNTLCDSCVFFDLCSDTDAIHRIEDICEIVTEG